ncbi:MULTISPECIES: hypothetical protein [unclassified Paenibacillus]|uniref:hypothetical protein n=1 Tax=unclassified Paenibacillus TaxID=185978 RepID=UPI0007BF95CC|nr:MULTISPECIES: hypothetical protein [unclassified Paenibacillus]PIH59165.1 hypothetical protein CS562_14615 [Paenibacillus sp. LK1]
MGQSIVRFGELKPENYTEGLNNAWITFSALPYSRQHSSGIDGDIVISATPTVEIVEVDLDVAINSQYEFAYSIGTDNKLKMAFDKTKYSKASAIETLKCISITYELGHLEANGGLYVAIARNSLGEEVHRTVPQTLDQLKNVISTFDDTRSVDVSGFLSYQIVRDYRVT